MVFVNTPGIEVVPPGPAGSIPTKLVVLSLVQLYVVAPEKLIVVKTAPEQTNWLAGSAEIVGLALTVKANPGSVVTAGSLLITLII